jgi:XTP/dITP diphosphohydrolase
MGRRLTGARLVIATHNPGKFRELAALFAGHDVTLLSSGELGLAEPEESGASFAENAADKARLAARGARLPALADDSGLAVRALGGAPGIHSARWAGAGRDFAQAMARVEAALAGKTDRRAAFVCVLALAWPEAPRGRNGDGEIEIFEGRVEGRLVWPPRGTGGFGYDSMFQPLGESQTFAEMAPAEKAALSHRAGAFARLAARYLGSGA